MESKWCWASITLKEFRPGEPGYEYAKKEAEITQNKLLKLAEDLAKEQG